eukprot:TCONS_00069658-protein
MHLRLYDATTVFHWPVSWISWLTVTGAGTHFLVITMLIKCHVFKGIKPNYFFLSALNTTMFILALMLLPKITSIKSYTLFNYFIWLSKYLLKDGFISMPCQ